MYVPSHFREPDLAWQQRAMREHPFALLVTPHQGELHMTWLPFLLDAARGPLGTLEAHLARANPHAAAVLAGAPSTVAFLGPHGYVSPRWYADPARQVPTWNFVAVHAHGAPRPVEATEPLLALVARLVAVHEAEVVPPWSVAEAQAHAERLAPHIVGFTLAIERLEAKRKLSQNRAAADRAGVLAALATRPADAALRAAMLELYREDGVLRDR
jgi:transcriptional regulator